MQKIDIGKSQILAFRQLLNFPHLCTLLTLPSLISILIYISSFLLHLHTALSHHKHIFAISVSRTGHSWLGSALLPGEDPLATISSIPQYVLPTPPGLFIERSEYCSLIFFIACIHWTLGNYPAQSNRPTPPDTFWRLSPMPEKCSVAIRSIFIWSYHRTSTIPNILSNLNHPSRNLLDNCFNYKG